MVHTALSVSFADSSPKGRAKGLVLACKPTDKLKFTGRFLLAFQPVTIDCQLSLNWGVDTMEDWGYTKKKLL